MLLTFVVNLALFGPNFETQINNEEKLAPGIIFHKEGKILITKKIHQRRVLSSVSPLLFYGSTTNRDTTWRFNKKNGLSHQLI